MTIATGAGAVLSRGAGTNPVPAVGTDTFNAVGRIKSFNGPNINKAFQDVTTLDSPGGVKEFISAQADPGELSMSLQLDPDDVQQQGLFADALANTANSLRNWRIVWPNGLQIDVVGEVSAANFSTTSTDPTAMDITIKLSGAPSPTWT